MKKIVLIAMIIAVTSLFGIFPALCLDTGLKVYDDAGLFTSGQLHSLQERAGEIAQNKQCDVVIVTTSNAQGKSSMAYADDYYDYNGFGYGGDKTGLLFLIDMDNRQAWISTTGKCIKYFDQTVINKILDNTTPSLTAGDYASAANAFLDIVNSTPTTPLERSASRGFIYFLIAVAVGGITVGIMSINNKGRKTTNAGTYLDPNSFILNDNRDIYIRTAVTKRYINTSSGGGGGTHSGSSGTSHGGGGRGF